MGDPPLCHLVNQELRMKIRFDVAVNSEYERLVLEDSPVFFARGDGLYPGTNMLKHEVRTLNLDKFLREMVMIINGEKISVRDLIDYVANAAGAVHFGNPEKGKRALLAALDQELGIGGMEAAPKTLIGVGRIVVDAFEPLEQQLADTLGIARASRGSGG